MDGQSAPLVGNIAPSRFMRLDLDQGIRLNPPREREKRRLVHGGPIAEREEWWSEPSRRDGPSRTGETIAMISVGERAPDFELQDHLGRKVKLGDFKGKRHVLMLFYPLDWTPT